MNEDDLKIFKYFLECYFNPSYDFLELPDAVEEFVDDEDSDNINELIKEVNILLCSDEEKFARAFISKYGMRDLNKNKIKEMLTTIKKMLLK